MKKVAMILAGAAGVALLGVSSFGMVSAATTSTSAAVGTSGIPRSIFRDERQAAVASVLGTSVSNVTAAHKSHSFKDLLTKAGLSRSSFESKLKTQLTTDLEAKGYSVSQIETALQHRAVVHYKHHHKTNTSKS